MINRNVKYKSSAGAASSFTITNHLDKNVEKEFNYKFSRLRPEEGADTKL
jgi:hypothetical protein